MKKIKTMDIISKLQANGWYRVTQVEHVDDMFEGEFSQPSGDYIFHPCVVDGKNPISGFGNFFHEDVYEALHALGLAWDFDDPCDHLVLGDHPITSTGDL